MARRARPALERLLNRINAEQRKFNESLLEALRVLEVEGHRIRVRLDQAERRADLAERRLDSSEQGAVRISEAVHRLDERLDQFVSGMRADQGGMRDFVQRQLEPLQDQLRRIGWELGNLATHAPTAPDRGAAVAAEATGAASAAEGNAALERLFVAGFSERFRGSRAEVKENVRWYADLLRKAEAGTADRPIVDLGCGRGELLEVLREQGLTARGVECAGAMVTQCRDLGFEVDEGEALGFLGSAKEGSLGAITAIHVAEHLSFPDLLAFFRLARRALAPGGMLVLETPNPDNLRVGARNFYLDPTHVRPLVPPLLQFIAESHDFSDVKVHPLHPGGELFHAGGEATDLARQLNEVICGPQDYALSAVRPR